MTGDREPDAPVTGGELVRWGTPAARWILLATVLGSGLVFLDATSSHVALPAIAADLETPVAGLQWTINAYTLALASLTLLGGSLGDRYGRRRVFIIGTVWFAAASLACGLAPTSGWLIAARALQGVGGALLTPGSLALLQTVVAPGDRARAIGLWSGLSGIAAAGGPIVGGWLVDLWTWRLIFLTNLPLAAAVVAVTARHVPETRAAERAPGLDLTGAWLAVVGLGLVTWSLIAFGEPGAPSAAAIVSGVAGLVALAVFVAVERRSPNPLLPLDLFASRQFVGANLVTVAVYGVFGGLFFLLYLQLQQVVGYSPAEAGAATLPLTGLLLVLSSPAGALAQRVGPRLPMTVGPALLAVGLLLFTRVGEDAAYTTEVLPAVTVFGLGLALTVAPLTATVLAAVEPRHAGLASGVNNALARAASLLAVAALPLAAGITGDAVGEPAVLDSGFRFAMRICAGIAALGALLAWLLVRSPLDACPTSRLEREVHCAVDGPPIDTLAPAPSGDPPPAREP